LQYDFEIIYRPGASNAEADCLSRNPVLESNTQDEKIDDPIRTVNLLTVEEIKIAQQNIKRDNKMYNKDGIIVKKIRGKIKIVLSVEKGRELIKSVHQKYGHIGASKIYVILKDFYTFPNMYKMACKLTTTCDICLCNKTRRRNTAGLLGHFGPASRPFEIMSLDTVGGLGGRRSTKRYLHILVDHFTRYAYILTSANQNTREFIRLISRVLEDHQIECLLTDQYGGLSSEEFLDFLEEQKIDHYYTAVNKPSSNGMNERLGQTLVNRIRCKINEKQGSAAWAGIAIKCTDEYNTTVHSSTGFTPAYLMYGKIESISPFQAVNDYESDLILAYNNSIIAHEQNKKRFDKQKTEVKFETGDEVYVENGNRLNREKLDGVRIGPFKVVRKLSNTVYEIEVGRDRKRNTRLYHVSKIVRLD
jgi:hypothetical protein